MSLVGSLEDLALGDILQIVSLSRKSGLLMLRSEAGDGRIFFREGLVQAAYVKGEPEDLRALLLAGGFADPGGLDSALESAREQGRSAQDAVAASSGLSEERLEALRREHVERAVLRMFRWRAGEFSFEVRGDMDARDLPLALPNGINAQYLTMEATRLGDEDVDGADDDFQLSGEAHGDSGEHEALEPAPVETPQDVLASATAAAVDEAVPETPAQEARDEEDEAELPALRVPPGSKRRPEPVPEPEPQPEPEPEPPPQTAAEPQPVAAVQPARPVRAPEPGEAPAAAPAERAPVPLVVIDPSLPALEWVKLHLHKIFARTHIFQHSEGGIARIRQYLGRAEIPVVLVSTRAPADTLTGAADVSELLSRLRAQAPGMPIVAMREWDEEAPPGVDAADALVARPSAAFLRDPKRRAESAEAGQQLRAAMQRMAEPTQGVLQAPTRGVLPAPTRGVLPAPTQGVLPARPSAPRLPGAADASLRALHDMSARLRDRATRGEVLNLVLDFAARRFRRVAMFMAREDDAVGIAQRGLPLAGGPSDEAFQALRVSLFDSAWLGTVVETGASLRAGPSNAGDHRLAAQLGSRAPAEAFVAPIESGGRVAALLYADNLPEGTPIGDTTVLAIVLHEAGLALDRAVLERTLAKAQPSS